MATAAVASMTLRDRVTKITKNISPRAMEALCMVPFLGISVFLIMCPDYFMPSYTSMFMKSEDMRKPVEDLATYRLEPIYDKATGSLVAMRKIRNVSGMQEESGAK